MAASLQAKLRAQRAATERWIEQRESELRRGAGELEARGRQAYANAIRAGSQVVARTPAEVRQLGVAAATGQLPRVVAQAAVRRVAPAAQTAARETAKFVRAATSDDPKVRAAATRAASENARAGVSGAVDEFTFGLADRGLAAANALAEGGPEGFRDRYKEQMLTKRAEDAADETRFGIARNAGRAVGFGASLAATGGVGAGARAVVQVAPRAARIVAAANKVDRIARLPPGGLNTLTVGGGAVAGVGGQFVSDLVTGHRSSASDYLAAGLGGVTGGLAMRAGAGPRSGVIGRAASDPRVAGAIEGASTEALKATFDGRQVELEDVAEAARAGAVGARVGDLVGKYGSNALPRRAKGALGEELTVLRARVAGEGNPYVDAASPDFQRVLPGAVDGPGLQRRVMLSRGYTIADNVTPAGFVDEAKFGAWASLSPAQRLALRELPAGRYRVNHWLPSDLGRMSAVGLAAPFSDMHALRDEWER